MVPSICSAMTQTGPNALLTLISCPRNPHPCFSSPREKIGHFLPGFHTINSQSEAFTFSPKDLHHTRIDQNLDQSLGFLLHGPRKGLGLFLGGDLIYFRNNGW